MKPPFRIMSLWDKYGHVGVTVTGSYLFRELFNEGSVTNTQPDYSGSMTDIYVRGNDISGFSTPTLETENGGEIPAQCTLSGIVVE